MSTGGSLQPWDWAVVAVHGYSGLCTQPSGHVRHMGSINRSRGIDLLKEA
jgi:hypothetical protein